MSSSFRLPECFLKRLSCIIPAENFLSVSTSFYTADFLCLRVNTLKADVNVISNELKNLGFLLTPVPLVPDAFIIKGGEKSFFADHRLIKEGLVYQQAPSSLLPAVFLDPKPGEKVLDACAAPGSKTSQMSALMAGEGEIWAVEAVRGRFYKLRSVCAILGVKNVRLKLGDARRLHFSQPFFDKVLVDAPCSSEGRFKVSTPKSFAYWSERKIKEMSHKQKGILLNASRGLKKGGRLIYSTCTFAPEENEEVVDWFLRKSEGGFRLEEVFISGVKKYPTLKSWKGRQYTNDLSACLRILPDMFFSGFFIACFKREN